MRKYKFWVWLLVFLLLGSMTVPSVAMDSSRSFRFTLSVDGSSSARVAVGDELTVTVSLSRTDAAEDWTMYSWQTQVAFDQNAFELVEDSVKPTSGIGSSVHPGVRETHVYFNAYSFFKTGSPYPAEREVGSFRLRAKWAGNYTIHNENYKVGIYGGADDYQCASSDLTVSVEGVSVVDRFVDVSSGDWFVDAVRFTVQRGLFQGVSETEFAPGLNMTRAMLVTVLHRLEGKPVPSVEAGFADVPSDTWYTDAVKWARFQDIVKGYSDTEFGPDDPITREQMATILHRYAKNKGYEVSQRVDYSRYEDSGAVSDWAAEAMSWANATGLIIGRSETTLNPRDTATRAEVATILMRFSRLEGIA